MFDCTINLVINQKLCIVYNVSITNYYKLQVLCLKFCMCSLHNMESTIFYRCSLSFLPQKFEPFVILITDISSFIKYKAFFMRNFLEFLKAIVFSCSCTMCGGSIHYSYRLS